MKPRTVELLRALAVSDLDPFIDLLNDQSDADGLRALFTTWITAPQPDLDVLSNHTWFARSKRKVREPDAAEMARWRLVAVTPETGGTLPIRR